MKSVKLFYFPSPLEYNSPSHSNAALLPVCSLVAAARKPESSTRVYFALIHCELCSFGGKHIRHDLN